MSEVQNSDSFVAPVIEMVGPVGKIKIDPTQLDKWRQDGYVTLEEYTKGMTAAAATTENAAATTENAAAAEETAAAAAAATTETDGN